MNWNVGKIFFCRKKRATGLGLDPQALGMSPFEQVTLSKSILTRNVGFNQINVSAAFKNPRNGWLLLGWDIILCAKNFLIYKASQVEDCCLCWSEYKSFFYICSPAWERGRWISNVPRSRVLVKLTQNMHNRFLSFCNFFAQMWWYLDLFYHNFFSA